MSDSDSAITVQKLVDAVREVAPLLLEQNSFAAASAFVRAPDGEVYRVEIRGIPRPVAVTAAGDELASDEPWRPMAYRQRACPKEIRESLLLYASYGVPTGDFLRAVLAGDLYLAVQLADQVNYQHLYAICMLVVHELPHGCWGSYAAVEAHLAKFRSVESSELSDNQQVSREGREDGTTV